MFDPILLPVRDGLEVPLTDEVLVSPSPAHSDSVPPVLLLQPGLQRLEVLPHSLGAHLPLSSHLLHGVSPRSGGSKLQHFLQFVSSLYRPVEVAQM